MVRRQCEATKSDGSPCQANPLKDGPFCLMHSPENAEAVAEGRKTGGQRRRKEAIVAAIYDLDGLRTLDDIQRVLEIAINDTLGQENSIARSRTLAYLAHVCIRALQAGDLKDRVEALEAALGPRFKRKQR